MFLFQLRVLGWFAIVAGAFSQQSHALLTAEPRDINPSLEAFITDLPIAKSVPFSTTSPITPRAVEELKWRTKGHTEKDKIRAIQCILDKELDQSKPHPLLREFMPSRTYPTAIYAKFDSKEFKIGNAGIFLEGCTVLCAISEDGVYMAHYWRTPGFIGYTDKNNPKKSFKVNFQGEVLDFIHNGMEAIKENPEEAGSPDVNIPASPSLTKENGLKKGNTRVFVYTPSLVPSGDPEFADKIERIRKTIVDEQTGLGKIASWEVQTYQNGDDDPLVRVLFEYDPTDSDGRIRLFFDTNQVFDIKEFKTKGLTGWDKNQ
ncbi:hypothetical protein VTL71DRAFT_13180 [Oculimacula yallundae]|uniref:Uncharacterized protein n=1 Tax=Oculimacula yallundae TaxID=86028 RepID=A0ABR4CK70_9HELO